MTEKNVGLEKRNEALARRAEEWRQDAQGLEIKTEADCQLADGLLGHLAALEAEILATFDGPISAAHSAHKAMIAARDKHLAPVGEAKGTLKEKIGAYDAELEAKEAGPEAVARMLPEMRHASIRKSWKAKVVDASQIPREYLIPDLQKIQKVAEALGDQTKIPGVEVERRRIVAVRK